MSQMAKNTHFARQQPPRLKRLPVFYSEKMIGSVASFSPSAGKPRAVLASWQKLDIPLELHDVEPVTNALLVMAHATEYVEGIFAGSIANGFRSKDPALAETCRYTVGAMLAAAREAVRNRQVAIAPVSGFHHASHNAAFGYCTFNGLLVTALALKELGLISTIGILDCDVHYGDGSQDIINRLGLKHWIQHVSMGQHWTTLPEHAEQFLADLPQIMTSFAGCNLLLYQAGADPHINDPLGGFLSSEQMLRRDRIVFEYCRRFALPVAWNLAGGYQRDEAGSIRPVLELHDQTLCECANCFL
ncbi:hypothetical protein [Chitinilyticum piscinae]|uniref:hypothetical protein n=1 Tax=Chitinilyticum piscinae TaxID=2866724 RepID=UPI00187FC904|nr:hypothetical protein [Chitinilyticum piscinae]